MQAFFAQIYSEAQSSRAAPGHVAIAELHKMGRLQRHYTLNIDGLAAVRYAALGAEASSDSLHCLWNSSAPVQCVQAAAVRSQPTPWP